MVKEYGYEYNAEFDKGIFSKTQWDSTDKTLWGAYCLRSGRDALKVIAKETSGATVYMPSLCCDSMIVPFEMYGCTIRFYPLTNELSANYAELLRIMEYSYERKVLLYYDYFGIPMFTDEQIAEVKSIHKNLISVKDITHTLLTDRDIYKNDDYTVASLRKWADIADGGLLWTKREVKFSEFIESPGFASKRLEAQMLRTEYIKTGVESLKTKYRAIFSSVSELLDSETASAKMTEYSYRVSNKTDWDQIKIKRSENANVLREVFGCAEKIKVIDMCRKTSNLYIPIIVDNRNKIQERLSKKGIFNTIIWPLREEQRKCCDNADYIYNHMLAVPCDQRYSQDDMEYIGKEIVRVVYEENNDFGREYSSAPGH